MSVPADFDPLVWFGALTFEGIAGRALARGVYRDLFRSDGFARPKADLLSDAALVAVMPSADEIERDDRFTAALTIR